MSERSPATTAFGWLLLVLGALWTLLTGGCTLMMLQAGGTPWGLIGLGLAFTAPGLLMVWAGLKLVRRPRGQDG
jgi:hypothetical protein